MESRRKLSVNRGAELNEKRRQGLDVDVHFRIGDEEFPAHKLIVGLKSPFLKALVSAPPGFKECGSLIDLSSQMPAPAFAALLDYIYSGEISLCVENVFDIVETAAYLQIQDSALMDFATEFLLDLIPCITNMDVFIQIWNVAEQFNLSTLSLRLYKVLEYRLESLLDQNILSHLGLEELSRLLSNSNLCLRDEQRLWDNLLPFIQDETEEDIHQAFTDIVAGFFRLNLISWASPALPESISSRLISESNLQKKNVGVGLPRNCVNCVYLFEYTKEADSLTNIESFLEDKKFGPSFAYLPLNKDPKMFYLSVLTNGKSYHQHYGPHSQMNYSMVTTPSGLLLLGGINTHMSSKALKYFSVTKDLKTFEYRSGSWLRWRSSIPSPCVDFGVIYESGRIYLFGGLSEDSVNSGGGGVQYLNSKLGISQKVFVAHEKDLTQMAGVCWKPLADMPHPRRDFACIYAQNRIYLVGHGFIDVYHLSSNSWSFLPPIDTHSKPGVALIGSSIYILTGKSSCDVGGNNFYALNSVNHTLVSLPKIPNLRFDVHHAFSHNNLFYAFVKQRSIQNALFLYDPEKGSWSQLMANIGGTLRPGVLLRTPWLPKNFFSMTKPIRLESR